MKLSTLIVPLLILALVVVAVLWFKAQGLGGRSPSGNPPFELRRPFLEIKEAELLRRLKTALPDHHVFAQVQVWRVLALKKGLSASERTSWQNSIDRLSYDFVLCDAVLAVVAVIELDGASHAGERQAARDRKKDDATKAAGIEMVRYRNAALPDIAALATRFASPAAVVMRAGL